MWAGAVWVDMTEMLLLVQVARRWGLQKNRPAMNYDKADFTLYTFFTLGPPETWRKRQISRKGIDVRVLDVS